MFKRIFLTLLTPFIITIIIYDLDSNCLHFSVYLEGIKMEGNDRGVIELTPTPYNVVLEDDSYKGEIKIGLKFFTNVRILPYT